tara:strand:- start:881 stop:1300 length:420 start_codon:yes stop_codon:yes gene_type:complete
MNIDIKLLETLYLDNDNLKELKFLYENSSVTVDSIPFDADHISLNRLKMLSYINTEIEFIDANNQVLSLSGSELNTYIPIIENNLGTRFKKINTMYNSLKASLSAGETITYYEGASAFFEDLYETSFTQNDFDELHEYS